jgi:F-box and WD-40 domain protein 1/11
LKFEREWHRRMGKGFMVSGSSDCSICVWDLWIEEGGGAQVEAKLRKTLRHHSGGVLDLRMCERWIVSW